MIKSAGEYWNIHGIVSPPADRLCVFASYEVNGTKPSTRAVIMQMPPVDCQPAGECFCQAFGLCNLTCTEGSCGKRYKLPQYSAIPDGWPEKGAGENGWPALGWND
jgi:hypothetical protein